jgi:hypothetical protein
VDRLGRVDQRPLDALFDPPRPVGAEPGALRRVESLHGAQQPDVAFLDEVGQRQPSPRVVLRDRHHQPQVRADHPLPGDGTVVVDDGPTEFALLLCSKKRYTVDFTQVHLQI